MRGTAEDLERKRLIHATRSFLQKMGVLILRIRYSDECCAKANANTMLRMLTRIYKARILQRQFRRGDGKLRIAIQSLQTMWRKKILRIPIANFARAMRIESARVECRNFDDAAFFRANTAPEILPTSTNACNRSDAGNDRATFAHRAAICDSAASKCVFMQRRV